MYCSQKCFVKLKLKNMSLNIFFLVEESFLYHMLVYIFKRKKFCKNLSSKLKNLYLSFVISQLYKLIFSQIYATISKNPWIRNNLLMYLTIEQTFLYKNIFFFTRSRSSSIMKNQLLKYATFSFLTNKHKLQLFQ